MLVGGVGHVLKGEKEARVKKKRAPGLDTGSKELVRRGLEDWI